MSLIMTIGAFLPGLFGKQVSDRVSRILGIAAVGIAVISLLGLAKCVYDGAVIAKHEAQEEARKNKALLDADRAADEATAEQARDLAETQTELEKAQAEAARSDPAGAAKPVGPVTESYYDTLRKKKGTPK